MCLGGYVNILWQRERKERITVHVRVILATAHSCWDHDEISVLGELLCMVLPLQTTSSWSTVASTATSLVTFSSRHKPHQTTDASGS